jgi:hypothetical protein
MADVQVAVRLRREARLDRRVLASGGIIAAEDARRFARTNRVVGQVLADDLADEVACRAWMSERATRECRMSPTMATQRFARSGLWRRIV